MWDPHLGLYLSIMYSLGIGTNIHYFKLCAFVLSQVVTHLFNFIFMPQSLPQTYTLLSCPQYWPSNKKNKWPFSRHQKAKETFILLIPPCCAMDLWPGCCAHAGYANVLDDYSDRSHRVRLAGCYICVYTFMCVGVWVCVCLYVCVYLCIWECACVKCT